MRKEDLKKKDIAIYFGSAIGLSERPNKKRPLTLEMIKKNGQARILSETLLAI